MSPPAPVPAEHTSSKMTMRILMISDVYFPRINGVSTSIQIFIRALEKRDHNITLIAPDYDENDDSSVNLIRVPSRKLIIDPEDRMMNMRWVMNRLEQLRHDHYDLIHVQTPFIAHYLGLKLARQLRLPVIETYHTYFEEYLYNYIPWLPRAALRLGARIFSRTQCNSVSHVIVPSAPIEQALRGYGIVTPMTIVPTGLELEKFSEGDGQRFRARYNIPMNRPMALYVGRMVHEKNIRFLLQAMHRAITEMPGLLFVMAGEGPAEAWARRWVELNGLQDNIHFVGYLQRETTLLDCYRAADVFVFASRTETQGLVLLEAMAFGTPVVSTAVLGTKTVLSHGHGALIAKEEVEDFSDKVLRLLRDETASKTLSKSALSHAREWSIDNMIERKLAVYASIIAVNTKQQPPVPGKSFSILD